jgi:hypothetical protein
LTKVSFNVSIKTIKKSKGGLMGKVVVRKLSDVRKNNKFCKRCFLLMALAEKTNADGNAHLRCEVEHRAKEFVQAGMSLCSTSDPAELLLQLNKLLEKIVREEGEESGKKIALIQEASSSVLGRRIDLAEVMTAASA